MLSRLKKAEVFAYKLLRENSKQKGLSDIVEYIICAVICLNVVFLIAESTDLAIEYSSLFSKIRISFFIFFLIEYFLRIWIADIVMKDIKHPLKARIKYLFTFRALINLFALFPVIFNGTFIDFRIFRILRLLNITQLKELKEYTDIMITVFKLKGAQLLSSLFIVTIFTLVSAVIIYDFENKVQPEIFKNILACFWWSVSAITTVGYGDMYPITPTGKVVGSFISIFGVFLMAIPIGILTSGFFEVAKKVDVNDKNEKDKM